MHTLSPSQALAVLGSVCAIIAVATSHLSSSVHAAPLFDAMASRAPPTPHPSVHPLPRLQAIDHFPHRPKEATPTTLPRLAPQSLVNLPVLSYDVLNGEMGAYTYFDESYSGEGRTDIGKAPLTNGKGDLADGVIATQPWRSVESAPGPGPYVGWTTISPTITFRFANVVTIQQVSIFFDDSRDGGVLPPVSVRVGAVLYTVPQVAATGTFSRFDVTGISIVGSTIDVFVQRSSVAGSFVFLSEIQFFSSTGLTPCAAGTERLTSGALCSACTTGAWRGVGASTELCSPCPLGSVTTADASACASSTSPNNITYSLFDDWRTSSASSTFGQWQLGFRNSTSLAFTPYDRSVPTSKWTTRTTSDQVNLVPLVSRSAARIFWHPGPQCQLTCVRFTAPLTSLYRITAAWRLPDGGRPTSDVRVKLPTDPSFVLKSYVDQATSYTYPSTPVMLSAGSVIEFCTGCGANGNYDSDTVESPGIYIARLNIPVVQMTATPSSTSTLMATVRLQSSEVLTSISLASFRLVGPSGHGASLTSFAIIDQLAATYSIVVTNMNILGAYTVSLATDASAAVNSIGQVATSGGLSIFRIQPTCTLGWIAVGHATACTQCTPGRYADSPAATFCIACTAGFASGAAASSCTACLPGTYSPSGAQSTCSMCAGGTFSSSSGASTCLPCMAGKVSLSAAPACSPCAAGTFSSSNAQSACNTCVAGTYSNPGATQCTLCEIGTFSRANGASSCAACGPGSTVERLVGASTCNRCASGTVTVAAGALGCTPCGAGTFTDASQSSCVSCPTGSFSGLANSGCSLCSVGRFSNAVGATSSDTCVECTGGQTSTAGASACSSCGAGSFRISDITSACERCAAGRFSSEVGAVSNSTCMACAAGRVSTPDRITCNACTPGRYSASEASVCVDCAPGSFAATSAAARCTPCAAGRYGQHMLFGQTDPRYCVPCSAGRYASDGATACASCTAGTFAERAEQGACVPCLPGFFSSGAEATTCTPCDRGLFSSTSGSSACTVCAAGRFSNSSGLAVCHECPAGWVSSSTGETTCTECPAGRYSSAPSSTACIPCLRNSYAPTAGSTSCLLCAPSEFTIGEGTVACTTCGARSYVRVVNEQPVPGGCEDCPAHVDCTDFGNPVAETNFWINVDSRGYVTAVPCSAGRCPGGVECAFGSSQPPISNPVCGACSEGLWLWDHHCVPCDEYSHAARVGLTSLIFLMCTVAVYIYLVLARTSTTGGLKIFLYFSQSALVVLGTDASSIATLLGIISMNPFRSSGSCLAQLTQVQHLLLGLIPPFVVLASLGVIIIASRIWWTLRNHLRNREIPLNPLDDGPGKVYVDIAAAATPFRWDRHLASLAALFVLTFTPLINGCFEIFAQISVPSGDSIVTLNFKFPGVRIDSSEWRRVCALGAIFFTIWCGVIPCLLVILLRRVHAAVRVERANAIAQAGEVRSQRWTPVRLREQPAVAGDVVMEDIARNEPPAAALHEAPLAAVGVAPPERSMADKVARLMYDQLAGAYRSNMFWYEIVSLLRRVPLLAVNAFLISNSSVTARLLASSLINVAIFIIHGWLQPFRKRSDNVAEAVSLATLVVLPNAMAISGVPLGGKSEVAVVVLLFVIPALLLFWRVLYRFLCVIVRWCLKDRVGHAVVRRAGGQEMELADAL